MPDPSPPSVDAPGGARSFASWRETAEALGAWLNILVRLAAVVSMLIVVFRPQIVPILKRFTVRSSEINILGSKFEIADLALAGGGVQITDDGKMLIAGIEASQIPDRMFKLEQSIHDLSAENGSLKATVEQLQALVSTSKTHLDDANHRLASTTASPVATGDLASQIAATTKSADLQLQTSATVADQAGQVVREIDLAPAVGYGVVVGADAKPEDAMSEVRAAQEQTGNPVILFKRAGSWRTVALFGTQNAAAAALPSFKKRRPDAYIVDIARWCPSPQRISPETGTMAQQKDCGF